MACETHTPTPWRMTQDLPGRFAIYGPTIRVGHEGTVTPCVAHLPVSLSAGEDIARSNAALIVAAVNERAALREALQALLAGYDYTLPAAWHRDRPVSLARAALALGEDAESRKEG